MNSSTHKLVKAIAVVAASAGFAVPAAGAATPDAFQRAVNIHNAAAYPDAFGRAVNIHDAALQFSASQVARTLGTPDTRDAARSVLTSVSSQAASLLGTPDTRDAARSILEAGAPSQVARMLGTPDTRDAALAARMPVIRIADSGGFSWGDAGVGAGSCIGFVLLLGGAGSVLLRQKRRLTSA